MSGRPPKPSALKLIEGNRGKRSLPSNEPDPAYLNDLTPPDHLPPGAAAVWSDLAPRLRAAMLLTELDTLALEWLCIAAAQHRRATAELEIDDGDYIKKNSPSPWLIIQSMAFKRAKVLCDAFGMSPAARARVVVNPQGALFPSDQQNGADRFFN